MIRITDFRQAGYLTAHGVLLISTEVNPKFEVVFVFDDSCTILLSEFQNSVEHRYDNACKRMHNLVRVKLQTPK